MTGSGTVVDEVGCLEVRNIINSFRSLCYDRSIASSKRVLPECSSSLNISTL